MRSCGGRAEVSPTAWRQLLFFFFELRFLTSWRFLLFFFVYFIIIIILACDKWLQRVLTCLDRIAFIAWVRPVALDGVGVVFVYVRLSVSVLVAAASIANRLNRSRCRSGQTRVNHAENHALNGVHLGAT